MALPPDPHARPVADLLRAYGRGALSIGPQILGNPWLPRAALERLALARLRKLVAHAIREVPFYARHFAGIDPRDLRAPTDVARLPFLTRPLVREAGDDLLARGADKRCLLERRSSGSSGNPIVTYFDPLAELPRRVQEVRFMLANGVRPWDRQLVFGDPSHGVPGPFAPQKLGLWRRELFASWLPPEEALAQLRDRRPEIIQGTLSNLRLLATYAHQSHGLGYAPRLLIAKGEPIDVVARELIESALGAPVIDCYASEETGIIAWQCPSGDGHHIDVDLVWVDVVNADGSPCRPGQTGELVLTNLYQKVMPFIRYRVADLGAIADEPCSCGRTLPLLRRMQGRKMELVQTPAGQAIHPMALMSVMESVGGVRSYRVAQPGVGKLELRVRWADDAGPEARAASATLITDRLHMLLGADTQVDVVDAASLAEQLGAVRPAGA